MEHISVLADTTAVLENIVIKHVLIFFLSRSQLITFLSMQCLSLIKTLVKYLTFDLRILKDCLKINIHQQSRIFTRLFR